MLTGYAGLLMEDLVHDNEQNWDEVVHVIDNIRMMVPHKLVDG